MKKEVIIVVLILALLLWLWSSKVNAQAPVITPPADETEPVTESYTVKSGDSIWKIAKKRLPVGTSNEVIYDYVVQISEENGKNPALIDGVLQKNVNDPDLIYSGEILVINQYTPN
jgi:nucleoid-associated protein YgaU